MLKIADRRWKYCANCLSLMLGSLCSMWDKELFKSKKTDSRTQEWIASSEVELRVTLECAAPSSAASELMATRVTICQGLMSLDASLFKWLVSVGDNSACLMKSNRSLKPAIIPS
jgi:hypothetical protein